jgi:hypothetical protein
MLEAKARHSAATARVMEMVEHPRDEDQRANAEAGKDVSRLTKACAKATKAIDPQA